MIARHSLSKLGASFAFLALAALVALAAPGCSESGQTPTCPALSLYDINAAGEANSPEVAKERAAAVAAGCMTDVADASVETP